MRSLLTAFLIMFSAPAWADYIVTGQIKGQVCTNFLLFSSCNMVTVDAVGGDGDQLFNLQKQYSEVSEHKVRKNGKERCWIHIKSEGLGFLSMAVNATLTPDFYTLANNGEYEPVDVEYLIFDCRKIN